MSKVSSLIRKEAPLSVHLFQKQLHPASAAMVLPKLGAGLLAMRVGALYQFPHASLSFFQLPLFYILVEIIDSSIKDYSI